jgi:hypothetical protein
MCKCGVKANYGLVPSELGIGHYCGHMVDYDEIGYFCGKHEIIFFLSQRAYDGQAKFLNDLKGRQVIAWKRGYGPQYVDLFVKLHKEDA